MNPRLVVFAAFTFIGLAPRALTQQVFVVGPPGPGVFSQQLQPAINAAANGDIILVKQGGGASDPWTINGKSLDVIAEAGSINKVAPGSVSGLQASQHVLIRGLQIVPRVSLTNNAGPVWLEECQMYTTFFLSQGADPIVNIANCASVTLQRCYVGGYVVDPPSPPALLASNSTVSLYSCHIKGAEGPWFNTTQPLFHGATGARIVGGYMFASDTQFIGGMGGMYSCCVDSTALGQAGGVGLSLAAPADLLSCTTIGGPGSYGPGGYGPPGAALEGTPPTILPGIARRFVTRSPVRELDPVALTFTGLPYELVGIYVSSDSMIGLPNMAFEGVFVVALTGAHSFYLGQPGADGTLSVSIQAPDLPPTLLGSTAFVQSFFFNTFFPNYVIVGPASAITVLDSSL